MTNPYGLSSMADDMAAIGLMESAPARGQQQQSRGGQPGRRAPAIPQAILQMESTLRTRFGGGAPGGRSSVLSRMNALAEGRQPQQRSAPRGTPRALPATTAAGRRRIAEAVSAFGTRARATPRANPALRQSVEAMARVSALAEEVRSSVSGLAAVNVLEATKGFANMAVISELLARRFLRMSKAVNERSLYATARTMTTLAERSAELVGQLKEYRNRPTVHSPALVEKFNQGMSVMLAGTQLYAALTEGDDAPFPVKPADPNADPFAGKATPTQAVEGDDPNMGGADPFANPLQPAMPGAAGTGAPGATQEAMPDSERDPFQMGATDPDLDNDPQAEGQGGAGPMGGGDSDPLGLGLGVTPPEQHPGADDPFAMGGK